jgi:hypothetical protein
MTTEHCRFNMDPCPTLLNWYTNDICTHIDSANQGLTCNRSFESFTGGFTAYGINCDW